MRDYRGVPYASLPEPSEKDFRHRLINMLSTIDYWARDASAGFARIAQGQTPSASGAAIPIDPAGPALLNFLYLLGRPSGQTLLQLGTETPLTVDGTASSATRLLMDLKYGTGAASTHLRVQAGALPHLYMASNIVSSSAHVQFDGSLQLTYNGGSYKISPSATTIDFTRSIASSYTFDGSVATVGLTSTGLSTFYPTGTVVAVTVRRSSGGAADIQRWDNSTGASTLVKIDSAGRLIAGANNSPTATGLFCSAPTAGGTAAITSIFSNTTGWAGATPTSGLWRLEPTLSEATEVTGVGATTFLRINGTVANCTGTITGAQVNIDIQENASALGPAIATCLSFTASSSGTQNITGGLIGVDGITLHQSSGTCADMIGVRGIVRSMAGAGVVAEMNGLRGDALAGANITLYKALYGGAITMSGGATCTTGVGLYLEDFTHGGITNPYALYCEGGQSVHVGNLRLGSTTVPAARLHLDAGTATAGTAPLLFASGTSLTTAVAGTVEFTTDDLFFTITTGAARKAFILDDGARLTSGKVPVATTNGRLIDGLTIAAGTYTPTRSAEANMDSNVTMTEAQYLRVGNTVTVSGRFTADPTLTATTTSFEMTLPVASNIGAAEDVAGTAFCGNIAAMGGEVIGVAANDTAKVQWKASDVTSQTWSFHFSYQVI